MITTLKKIFTKDSLRFLKQSPVQWIYSAYLTLRYVDEWNIFPAIVITGRIKIRIHKKKGASIKIKTRLYFEQWLNEVGVTVITLSENSIFSVEGEFILGQQIKVYLSPGAKLLVRGKNRESGSGITAQSVVMVNSYLEIGEDCLIAWNTFITDCDWHTINGKNHTKPTIIGDHVWIGVGSIILKGVNIGKNTIVSSNSTVLQGSYPESILIAGNPGRIIKEGVSEWQRDLI
jgi:acetyltransferase-like isoleucine patch superfamily enzyme